MRVVLHVGAHRCATTSFQAYTERKAAELHDLGILCLGPTRLRSGLFHGIQPAPLPFTGRDQQKRARGRIVLQLRALRDMGIHTAIFSDAQMMGRLEDNLASAALYAGVGERLARYDYAFDGAITDVVVNIRALDTWWASAISHSLQMTDRFPHDLYLDRLAQAQRSWRDVITDIYCAMPGAKIWVLPHEDFATRPAAQLSAVLGYEMPQTSAMFRLKPSLRLPLLRGAVDPAQTRRLPEGNGRWLPFGEAEAAALRETYADDLMWLVGGADGYATLLEHKTPDPLPNAGGDDKVSAENAPHVSLTEGRPYDPPERRPKAG